MGMYTYTENRVCPLKAPRVRIPLFPPRKVPILGDFFSVYQYAYVDVPVFLLRANCVPILIELLK